MVPLSSLLAKEECFPVDSQGLSKLKLPGSTSILKPDGSGFEEDHSGILIEPTPGFVIKTRSGDSKVFINVCYCDKVEKPGIKHKLDDDGKEVEGWNVPLSMGPIRKCLDKANNRCNVVDAVVHPSLQDDIQLDTSGSHRNFICQILMQCFDRKYKELSPLYKKYTLPNTKYIGYVNVETGEVVRKMCKDVEVCKQYIKDTSSRPKILQEISQSPTIIENKVASPLKTRASKTSSSGDRFLTNHSLSSSSNKIHAISTKTKSPLILSINVYLKILVDGGDTKLLSVQEFLDALHEVHYSTKRKDRALESQTTPPVVIPTKWDAFSTLPLILDSCDFEQYFKVSHVVVQASTSSNFCSDSIDIFVSAFCLKVMTKSQKNKSNTSSTTATTNSSSTICKNNIQQQLDNNNTTIPTTSRTQCIKECILPFCVNTQHVKCTFHPNTHTLSISMEVSSTSICQKADVGSQPWLLANALSSNKSSSSSTSIHKKKKSIKSDNDACSDHDNNKDTSNNHNTTFIKKESNRHENADSMNENNVSDDDDPFHLRSPFPWKQNSKHKSITSTTATSSTSTTPCHKHSKNKKKSTAANSTTNKKTFIHHLPEDRFHQNDCMSQYLLEKQQQQQAPQHQQQGQKTSYESNHKDLVENILFQSDDIGADDETGKLCSKKNVLSSSNNNGKNNDDDIDPSSSSSSSDGTILLGAADGDSYNYQHHVNCIRQAEEMLKTKCSCSTNRPPLSSRRTPPATGVIEYAGMPTANKNHSMAIDAAGGAGSYENWWYKMMH
jgi:pre-RNA processing PIH1/Nop17.